MRIADILHAIAPSRADVSAPHVGAPLFARLVTSSAFADTYIERMMGLEMDDTPAEPQNAAVLDFGGVYRAHAAAVRRFAIGLSGDPALADDIVSETFIRMWGARTRLDLTTVRAYLFAIARNIFLKHRHLAHRTTSLEADVAGSEPSVEIRMQSRRDLDAVLLALQTLPEVDRAALLMRADDDLSYEDIGRALGISTVAARVKVHRARLKLAEARFAGSPPARLKESDR